MKIVPGLYRHYKGDIYRVWFVARQESDLKKVVVYEGRGCIDNPLGLWVRSIEVFNERVLHNGVQVKRFELIKKNTKSST